jgi:hypothetical protein
MSRYWDPDGLVEPDEQDEEGELDEHEDEDFQ